MKRALYTIVMLFTILTLRASDVRILDLETMTFTDHEVSTTPEQTTEFVALEALRSCIISVDNPERCKVCVSDHNMSPLICDVLTGYDSRRPVRTRENNLCTYLDVNTGERFKTDEDLKCFDYEITEDGRYEYRINYVCIIKGNEMPCNNTQFDFAELWNLQRGLTISQGMPGYPSLPCFKIEFNKDNDSEESNILHLIESDNYVDFKDIEYMPGYIYSDMGVYCMDPMEDYDGFYPEAVLEGPYDSKHAPTRSWIYTRGYWLWPMQYNQKEKTLRVYRRIVLQRGNPSGVGEMYDDSKEYEYYNIDGTKVSSPEKGKLYIRLREGKAEKVIF